MRCFITRCNKLALSGAKRCFEHRFHGVLCWVKSCMQERHPFPGAMVADCFCEAHQRLGARRGLDDWSTLDSLQRIVLDMERGLEP
jgi:hypothetical protein